MKTIQILLRLAPLFLLGILLLGSTSSGTALELNHDGMTETDDYDNLTMEAKDQPLVDGNVVVRVTYNHTAVVMVKDGDTMVGHGVFAMPSDGHSHHMPAIMTLSQMDMHVMPVMTIHVLVKIHDMVDVVGKTLQASVFMDMQGDGMVNGSDMMVMDTNGDPLMQTFTVTESLTTAIEVEDQEIDLEEPYVIITRVVVPGPSWQVLHGFDNGALGPMYGIREQLHHGVNVEVQVDLTAENLVDLELAEPGDNVKIFAHLHHDYFDRGNFNGTTDPHIFSPAFDDEILGNDSAVPFVITVAEESGELPISIVGVSFGIIAIAILRKRLN